MKLWIRVPWFSLRIPAAVRLALDTAGVAAIFALSTAVVVCSSFGLVLAHRPALGQIASAADRLVGVFFISFAILGEVSRRQAGEGRRSPSAPSSNGRWSSLVRQLARAGSLALPLASIFRLLPARSPGAPSGAELSWILFVLLLYPCWLLAGRAAAPRIYR